jgi:hypothetical protein
MYTRIFSDNILVAIELSRPENFFSYLLQTAKFCTMFQLLALSKGLFVRGAIACGDFIGNDIFVYGEALVNAYEAETTCAIYPRIIIDKTVWDNFPEQRYRTLNRHEFFQELFKLDIDGQWYVSPFGITPPTFQLQDKILHLGKVKDFLIAEYQNSKKEKYKQKYFWLIQKFNEFCNRHQDCQYLRIPLSECDPKFGEVML